MTDVYVDHTQFTLLGGDRRRPWFDPRTACLLTIICLPIIIFCGVYLMVVKDNGHILYPKSHLQVPFISINRAKLYSDHPVGWELSRPLVQEVPSSVNEFKLVCYYNFPSRDFSQLQPEGIDPFLCTHIIVGFATVYNNTVQLNETELAVLKDVVALKKINDKLQVLLSVGGAGGDQGFPIMVRTHANRKTFIRSVIDYVKLYKLDGVDLDWEFPNSDASSDKDQKIHFVQLLEEFRTAINRQSRHRFLLTAAVAAPVALIDDSYKVDYMNRFVDFINLMSYDFHFFTKLTPFTGLNSPLFASEADGFYFSTLNINFTANYWNSSGMDRAKIMVGLPTYGHTYRLMNVHNTGLYAPARGYGKLGGNGFADYSQVCKFLSLNRISPIFDDATKSPYAYKQSEWISFDNEQSLSIKTEFVRDQQFGGVMVYSLNNDDHMGVCRSDPNVDNQPFPLIKKIREILNQNYSIF